MDFQWDFAVHGGQEIFWILVEDVNSEHVLYWDQFVMKQAVPDQRFEVEMMLPIQQPMPPNYFVRVISDRWLVPGAVIPIRFQKIKKKLLIDVHVVIYNM